ncbi:flagellin N-terminal helical domain-containing protein [Aliarcobacter cryaerophilus]|uniref:flagellin N-terminal helical domain-containing protein n=3 Tax=Aliarcobacter cryaerophilus TaxID=28198 RepID=UPI0021B6990F|nr:flagellin [Aliarcobacter cryaerophilus]MCT7519793.1 flagellin [Aliarcobacter cryaerophilus]
MRINTNISSLGAQEAAQNTNKNIANSLEKLSTGLKINKASDDASGLAIADKLRTQVTSINQGIANGNSAIALLQIADKSMSEQGKILDTIKSKLIQANTDTTSADGREAIRKDISKLLTQLDNIAKQTNYNGTSLLQSGYNDQKASAGLSFQIGENKSDLITNSAVRSNTLGLGGGDNKITSGAGGAFATGSNILANSATMQLKATSAITFETKAAAGTGAAESLVVGGKIGKITAVGNNLTITKVDKKTEETLKLIAIQSTGGFSYNSGGTEFTFTLTTGKVLDLNQLEVASMQLDQKATGTISITSSGVISVTNLDTNNKTTIGGNNVTGGDVLASLAALKEGELTVDNASKFQGVIDSAITGLNGYRGDIGSTQNQVESAVRNLMTQSTNIKAAESIIRDVDYAEESANFNKLNIISQAGSYAISQSNATQQNVLRLLQ